MKRDSIYTIAILCLAFAIILGFGYFVGVNNAEVIYRDEVQAAMTDVGKCDAAFTKQLDELLTCQADLKKRENQLTDCIDFLLNPP
jgi:hypothetical protein